MRLSNQLNEKTFTLSKAILLRESSIGGNRQLNSEAIASIHPITCDAKRRFRIGAGELLTDAGMAVLVKALIPEQGMRFIPERVLASGVEGVLWWKKPTTQMVWFNTDIERDGIGIRSGLVPLPGLVYFANGRDWKVFAVKGSDRPTAQTELFVAPFYNVWSNGEICRGNTDVPMLASLDNIDLFERAFFESRFTHQNVQRKKDLTRYRGGAQALWRALLDGKKTEFPQASLVPMGVTLNEWIANRRKSASNAT